MGFVANFIRCPATQKVWKSVKIWQSYREYKGGNFFLRHSVVYWSKLLKWHCQKNTAAVLFTVRVKLVADWLNDQWCQHLEPTLEWVYCGMWGSAGLKMPAHAHFFRQGILICKVGQTGLVFSVWSGFISRSMHATLQISAAAMIRTALINTQTHRETDGILTRLCEWLSQLS